MVVDDPAFAQVLAGSIREDIAPENSWVIGPRDPPRMLPAAAAWLGKNAEYMPVFDLWPIRSATRYAFVRSERCPVPPEPTDPAFRDCHEPIGDFDEAGPLRKLLTRFVTAFGGVLIPML